ncbi:MAG: hypothetical protein ABSC61_09145 [Anaerolineales bacterium]
MEIQPISNTNQPKLSFRMKIALILGSVVILVALFSFGYFAFVLYGSGVSIFSKSLNINVDEVPMYPNAHNIINEEPLKNTFEVHKWKFTTIDTPEMVWKFYVYEMGRRWGFYDSSSPQSAEKSLIVHSCPFYSLDMTSTSIDTNTYSITIRLLKEPCI